MTPNEAYTNFIIKINANATTDNISCDKGRFSLMYNEEFIKLVEFFLDRRYEDDVRYIQGLLVDDFKLSSSAKRLDHELFHLPKNYFDFSSSYVVGSRDFCKFQRIEVFEIKNEDRDILLSDENSKPSWKYRETVSQVSADKVKIYTNNEFTIDSAYLTYYRYPKKITLVNPENPESDFVNAPLDLDEKFNNRVIDLVASKFFLNNRDERFEIQKVNSIQKP